MSDDIAGEVRDSRRKLRATVATFNVQSFAVVDGGHFEDLPKRLRRERLFARSLFLEQVDLEIQKAGPWLVPLDQAPEATDQVFAIVGDRPAAVFWHCSAGEAVLYRHLRTINMVRVPVWVAKGKSAPSRLDDVDAYRSVFFRHFDPRVLGALMPFLDAAQFSRFLGPADETAYDAEDYGGASRIVGDDAWPSAPSGLLTVRSAQAAAMSEYRAAVARGLVAGYLREALPEIVQKIQPEKLDAFVVYCEETGRGLGLETQGAYCGWAYLMMVSRGHVFDTPDAVAFIKNGPATPDLQLEIMLDRVAQNFGRLN